MAKLYKAFNVEKTISEWIKDDRCRVKKMGNSL